MNVLFIGGTGTISMAITRLLLQRGGCLFLLNRGNRNKELEGSATFINADIHDEEKVQRLIKNQTFDCVVDFIAFKREDVERDYRLFAGKTKQYIFISSASAYKKGNGKTLITEETPLENPYWEYSRNKIECEALLHQLMEQGFPATIVRPSHTYDDRKVPVAIHGKKGSYQILKRMKEGKPVIIHDNGESLWTLTHSSDFAKRFVSLIGNPKTIKETYHITSDESLTWNQIYQTIARCLGAEFKAVYISSKDLAESSVYDLKGTLLGDKANSVVFDNSKIKAIAPEEEATTSFEAGVRGAIENILDNPNLQIEDPEFDRWCDEVIQTGVVR